MLVEKTKKFLLECIAQLDVYEGGFLLIASERRLVRQFLDAGFVGEEEVKAALHRALIKMARECYTQHRKGQYPDHTKNPCALAYGLVHKAFSPREVRKIRFDHGDTIESFIASFGCEDGGGRYLDKVFEQLTAEPKPVPSHSGCSFCQEHGTCFDDGWC